MKLIHYSEKPWLFDHHKRYDQRGKDVMKPRGLWVSVEGEHDWVEWCKAENFRLHALQFQSEIVLRSDHDIMVIDSVELLDAFTKKYVMKDYPFPGARMVYWPRVERDCGGVIIAPYQWDRRMECMWYYGWDCASGCIWDLGNIESVIYHHDNGVPGGVQRYVVVPEAYIKLESE